jgi:ribose transport system ATP-binding protein
VTSSVITLSGVSRSFGQVRALQGANFELRKGEVMALLGENGAGKSTLVKILGGLIQPDAGTVLIDGRPAHLGTPRRSRDAGIAVVAQELSIIGPLSAAENIFLGGVRYSGPWSLRRLARAAKPHLDAVGLEDLDPRTPAESLSVAQRQLVEFARLLARDARILILDEPTAALSDNEIELVKRSVTRLAAQGYSVIYVTHRLGEVFEIAHRVTVLRNGNSLPPRPTSELTMASVIEDIVGRPLEEMYPEKSAGVGEVVLEVESLLAHGLSAPVTLHVRAGEIVGLAGQAGSGNGVVLQTIAGVVPASQGRVLVDSRPLPPAHTLHRAIRAGVTYCSADRKLDGIFSGLSVTENLTAPSLREVSSGPWLRARTERHLAEQLAERFAISRSRLSHRAGTLSGGNQQKVALGKWLGASPKVLLVEEPTRGVDVGARAEIYRHLRSLADHGLAIIFASSDLDEVRGLSDTVGTLFRGHLIRTAPATAITASDLLRDVTHEGNDPTSPVPPAPSK